MYYKCRHTVGLYRSPALTRVSLRSLPNPFIPDDMELFDFGIKDGSLFTRHFQFMQLVEALRSLPDLAREGREY